MTVPLKDITITCNEVSGSTPCPEDASSFPIRRQSQTTNDVPRLSASGSP